MPSLRRMKTGDFAQYCRCFGLDGLEVVSARWVKHSFAPHIHDFYAVSLNYGGRGAFDCRRELRDAAPGTCNLIAPGELHTGHATSGDGWIYRNLYIEPPSYDHAPPKSRLARAGGCQVQVPIGPGHRLGHAARSRVRKSDRVKFIVTERVIAIVGSGTFDHRPPRARARAERCGARARGGPASQGLARRQL